jgi:hypothetical protein
MSGSAPQNNQAVQFEEQQAAQAQQQEAQRQAALTQGQGLINKIFDFSPATPASTSNYDWSTFQAPTGYDASGAPTGGSGVPSGYKAVQVASPYTYTGGGSNVGGYHPIGGTAGASTWELQDASGKDYAPGSQISINTPAQAEGGFGPDFYQNYTNEIENYYQPDEQRQYQAAQRDLTYNLARAGTLDSSYAADATGNLAYNDALQKANIVANANQQTGALQSQIAANKQSMINELYSTQDPTLTANLAQESANASRLQAPNLTPAAALFSPALTAAGSTVTNLLNPAIGYGGGVTGSVYANPGGNVASASASSGAPVVS